MFGSYAPRVALFAVVLIGSGQCHAAELPQDIIEFNDNGAWSWFEDERVVLDGTSNKVWLSSVANSQGPGGADRAGNIEVVAYDINTRSAERFTLHAHLEEDDHNSAALLILPDGRCLASYSKHASDNRLRYRVTAAPGEVASWGREQAFNTSAGTTYSNLFHLRETNTIFNFHRDRGRGFDPNYLVWQVEAQQGFHYGGRLLTGPEGGNGNSDRPYLRYASNGIDRIDFLVSDHHPRDLISNNVYHGYIAAEPQGFGLYRSDGTRIGKLSTDGTSRFKASDFTKIFAGNSVSPANHLRMTRGWPTDIESTAAGYPHVVFTARVADDDHDHRFMYARCSSKGWQVHELAEAGGFLYPRENDYTGLAALDPNDPNHLFISTSIDPRTHTKLKHYEIFEGRTSNGGKKWAWTPITYESSVDNLRPVVPRGARSGYGLMWMRGHYQSFTQYDTRIVGIMRLEKMDVAADKSTVVQRGEKR